MTFAPRILLSVIILIIFQFHKSHANYLAGSEIFYEVLSDSTLYIEVYHYRDCSGNPSPSSLVFTAFSDSIPNGPGSRILPLSFNLTKASSNFGFPGIENVDLSSGRAIGSNICDLYIDSSCCLSSGPSCSSTYEVEIYKDTINLPNSVNQWVLNNWQNNTPTDLNNLSASTVATRFFVDMSVIGNRSPRWHQRDYFTARVNQRYTFDLGGFDSDSVVYEFVPLPTQFGSPAAVYLPGYTYSDPFAGTSSSPNLDDNGLLSFKSTVVENSLVCIKVSEYRNGVLIGYSYRSRTIRIDPTIIDGRSIQLVGINAPNTIVNGKPGVQFYGDTLSFAVRILDSTYSGDQIMAWVNNDFVSNARIDSIVQISSMISDIYLTAVVSNIRVDTIPFVLKVYLDQCPHSVNSYFPMYLVRSNCHAVQGHNIQISQDTACLDSTFTVNLQASPINPGWSYNWLLPDGSQLSGSNVSGTFAYVMGASPNVQLTVSDSFCTSVFNKSIYTESDCVWPGDMNDDGLVDNFDIFSYGYYKGLNGSGRSIRGLNWQAHAANDWGVTVSTNQVDAKHTDADGNGIIDSMDVMGIVNNYTFSHLKTGQESDEESPALIQSWNADTFYPGDTAIATFSILPKDSSVYSFVFRNYFNPDWSVPNSLELMFDQGLSLQGRDYSAFALEIASGTEFHWAWVSENDSAIRQNMVVAQIRFVVSDQSIEYNNGIAPMRLGAFGGQSASGHHNFLGLEIQEDIAYISRKTTGIYQGEPTEFKMYPNPAVDVLHIEVEQSGGLLTVYDLLGNKIKAERFYTNEKTLNLQDLQPGVYSLSYDYKGSEHTKLLIKK